MFKTVSSVLSCRSRNWSRVSTFASGNSRTARSSAVVFASVTPPRMLMKVNSLSRFANERSKAALEIAIAPNGGDDLDAVGALGGAGGLGVQRVVLRVERVVGDEQLRHGVAEGRAEPLAEDRHEGHQREPDHECRRRRGRAARVAHRVVARELAGEAT